MREKIDYRRLTQAQKQVAWLAAGEQADQTATETLLEGPELTLSWKEVYYRGFQAGDRYPAGQLVYLEPHQTVAALHCWRERAEKPEMAEESLRELRELLHTACTSPAPCLILAPIQAGGPDHWTALIFMRQQPGSQFVAKHYDSLSQVHKGCRRQAEDCFACLAELGVAAQAALPPTDLSVHQKDGWSCGWQTVNRFEEAYRQFRGEGFTRIYVSKEQRRKATNFVC